jgi:hypothetical protein
MASSYASMPLDGTKKHSNSEDVCGVDATSNTISTTIEDNHDHIHEEDVPLMGVAVDKIGSPELAIEARHQQQYTGRVSSALDYTPYHDTGKESSSRKSWKMTQELDNIENENENDLEDMEDRPTNQQPFMVANGDNKTSGKPSITDTTASAFYPRGRHRSAGNNATRAMSRSPSTEAMDNSSFSDSDVDSDTAKVLIYCKHPSADLAKVVTRHVTMTRLLGAITFLTCLFALLSTHAYFNYQLDRRTCDMTYLRPIFKRLDQFDSEYTHLAGKYALYLYREDGYDSADEVNT